MFQLSLYSQQYTVSGRVTDNNSQPVVGANIIVKDTFAGTAADAEGNFFLNHMERGEYILIVSAVGYSKFVSDTIKLVKNISDFNVSLNPVSFQSDQVIVTAGKHEQALIDLPVSAAVIDASGFTEKNFVTLDEALRYTSGVSAALDQLSIRGSSGYSKGAGSRVLAAFDGIPIYTGDSGEIIWEQIPPYEIGRVEIIKGAGSSLYGSNAIGGVINVIPRRISANPLTYIKTFFGVYDNSSHDEWNWSDKTRTYNGFSVSHSQTFGRLGISASFFRFEDYGYRQNDYDRRLGGYFKLDYTISENSNIKLWGTGFTRQRETFNFWKDINHALSPPDEDIGDSQPSNRNIFALTYNQKISEGFSISSKSSMYRTHWHDQTESSNNSTTYLFRSELKSIYEIGERSLLISGIETFKGTASSNIFGNNNTTGTGIFTQFEFEFQFPLKVTVGIRYDYNKLKGLESESALSPKLGLNYKLTRATTLRGSVGTGFRAPSLAEAFTSTTSSGLSVKPNPEIKSESNISMEIGINHNFSERLNIDAAVFRSEYFDMIDPVLDPADASVFFTNITRARIQGFEINSSTSLADKSITFKLGYTYLLPRDIEKQKDLNYRSRNEIVASADWQINMLKLGLDFRHLSRVKEINDELVDFGIVKNGERRVDIKILDARLSTNLYNLGIPIRIFLNAKNLLNYYYVEMIGNLAPLRNYSVAVEWMF